MTACKKHLLPHGSFYIAIGDDYAANVKIIADEFGLFMRNWIIWHYTFGQQTKNKFTRSHTHIFYFVNDKKNFTFNDYAVRVPSDRQLIYDDKRANTTGKMPDDVWDGCSRVCGTFKERTGWHPCQMPESLLKRIISASSNPGDCVLDPFSGSGTTAAAAYQLGRNYVGIEISPEYVKNANERLAKLNLKLKTKNSKLMSVIELAELKRLLDDIKKPLKEIAADRKLLRLFANQFKVRMNNQKEYSTEAVAAALGDLTD
jgi:site-specific DNA-methyltransferase (adenine-specific)